MARGDRKTPAISNAEWEVMKVLWEQGPLAARDVIGSLPGSVEWAPKTVKTLLSRLVAKGALSYEQVGNSYVYRASCTRDEVTHQETRGFVERVFGGSVAPLVAHFLREHKLTDAEVEELKQLLERPGRKGKKR